MYLKQVKMTSNLCVGSWSSLCLMLVIASCACEDSQPASTDEPAPEIMTEDNSAPADPMDDMMVSDQEDMSDQEIPLEPIIVPEFGRASERRVLTVAHRSDGLSHPRDLEFDPDNPDQLWIVDRDWAGNIILFEAGRETQRVERLRLKRQG